MGSDLTGVRPPRDRRATGVWQVWLDFWSVPQAAEAVVARSHAIDAIPAFVEASAFMLVICPPVVHEATGKRCDFASWCRRGWCRLEKLSFALFDYSVTRPSSINIVHGPGAPEQLPTATR